MCYLNETINWIAVDEGLLPDSDTTVLIFGPQDEPVWLGWYDAEEDQWYAADAHQVEVTHWADIPKGPV